VAYAYNPSTQYSVHAVSRNDPTKKIAQNGIIQLYINPGGVCTHGIALLSKGKEVFLETQDLVPGGTASHQ
jgi:hypothetical protein